MIVEAKKIKVEIEITGPTLKVLSVLCRDQRQTGGEVAERSWLRYERCRGILQALENIGLVKKKPFGFGIWILTDKGNKVKNKIVFTEETKA